MDKAQILASLKELRISKRLFAEEHLNMFEDRFDRIMERQNLSINSHIGVGLAKAYDNANITKPEWLKQWLYQYNIRYKLIGAYYTAESIACLQLPCASDELKWENVTKAKALNVLEEYKRAINENIDEIIEGIKNIKEVQ